MLPTLKLATRNIRRHVRYSIGSALAVVAGFLALVLFQAYMLDVSHLYEDSYEHRAMYGHIIIEHVGTLAERRSDPWGRAMTVDQQNWVNTYLEKRKESVDVHMRYLFGSGLATNGSMQTIFLLRGFEVDKGLHMRGPVWAWNTSVGNPLHLSSVPNKALVGMGLASLLGCEFPAEARKVNRFGGYDPGERPFHCPFPSLQLSASTESGQSGALDFTIVGLMNGVYRELDERIVTVPLELAQQLYQTQRVSAYSVLLKDRDSSYRFVEDFNREVTAAGLPIYAIRWQDHSEGDMYRRTMSLLGIFRNFVVSILVVITGLSVFNTFLKAVKERTREIGTLRSIGFSSSQMIQILSTEAALLCVFGALAGVVLALVLTSVLNRAGVLYKAGLLADPVPFHLAYDFGIYVTSAVFLVSVSCGAAIFAAWGTTKAPIVENLAHV